MDSGKGIKVKLHRGATQIGGVCTEVFTDKTRIFFDFGSPLEGEGNQDKLKIDGLTRGIANTDAVFITHYHGDHVGEVPDILPDIPVYMHKTAKRILQAQQEHKEILGQIVWAKELYELNAEESITIKDIKITPLESDHSACDSLMYLVEGCGKRVLITGDYRLHGFYGDKVMKTFKTIGHIDLMITEGTNIDRESPYSHDEKWVEEQFFKILRDNKYVFLLTSSSNTDRIAAFTRAVPRGKHALADVFQTKIMRIADEEREEALKSHKLWPYDEDKRDLYEQRGFGMVVRASDKFIPIVKEYFEGHPADTCLVYSMWTGYKKKSEMAKMLDIAKGKIEAIHVSGHITKEDLEQVVDIVSPRELVIHHTQERESNRRYINVPKQVYLRSVTDGETIIV
ncbi:MAG: MBL fold metallo-hydrolase [Lachnospiraceae bacterium]|nr:MBL fold metallo-hydrolase [Lachnospiraceae bacterium]